MDFTYNWLAAIVTVVSIIGTVVVGKALLFRVPALARTLQVNKHEKKRKWQDLGHKYHHRIKSSQQIGVYTNLAFFVIVLPFIVTAEQRSLVSILFDAFIILMIYDFLYYLTHRFLFHGKGYFRKVHAVHHQARSRVSSIDAYLLHPLETFIGIALFYLATLSMMPLFGQPFHIATIVITYVVFTQINGLNHCRVDLFKFPYRTINWIAIMHDAHHQDMHRGNYATITLLYDWLFRTLEKPVEQDKVVETAS